MTRRIVRTKRVSRPDIKPDEFVANYTRTHAKKLKKVIEEEVTERIGLS